MPAEKRIWMFHIVSLSGLILSTDYTYQEVGQTWDGNSVDTCYRVGCWDFMTEADRRWNLFCTNPKIDEDRRFREEKVGVLTSLSWTGDFSSAQTMEEDSMGISCVLVVAGETFCLVKPIRSAWSLVVKYECPSWMGLPGLARTKLHVCLERGRGSVRDSGVLRWEFSSSSASRYIFWSSSPVYQVLRRSCFVNCWREMVILRLAFLPKLTFFFVIVVEAGPAFTITSTRVKESSYPWLEVELIVSSWDPCDDSFILKQDLVTEMWECSRSCFILGASGLCEFIAMMTLRTNSGATTWQYATRGRQHWPCHRKDLTALDDVVFRCICL